jgi:hypothetical protein
MQQRALNYFGIFVIFFTLFAAFFHPITAINQDLGRHFLTGKIILETHIVPKTNLFSYTNPNFLFINHHWLSEVILYSVYNLVGYNGLLIFSTLIIFSAFALLFFSAYKKVALVTLCISSFLFFGVLFERTDIRPEIFSALFLSLFIVILYKNRAQSTKLIYLLPFIELLWVNMHIYFPIGIAVLGLFFIEEILTHRKNLNNKHTILLFFILFFSTLFTLINPNGLSGALYPFHVFDNYGYAIEENQNIFFLLQLFQKSTIYYFLISAFVLSSVLLLRIKKTSVIDWLLTLFFVTLGVLQERNFLLFVFALFIPFALHTDEILKRLNSKKQLVITYICLALLIWQGINFTSLKGFGFGVEERAKNAVDFLKENNIKGPFFNNFDIGSYLEFRLYPNEQTFIDGRPEAYPTSFITTYTVMQKDPKIFEQTDKQYQFNAIFFAHTDQTPWAASFVSSIVNNPSWSLVYLDDTSLILLKKNSQNESLIKKYEMERKALRISSIKNDRKSLIYLLILFENLGWSEYELQIIDKLLVLSPTECQLLSMGHQIISSSTTAADTYLIRLNQYCR